MNNDRFIRWQAVLREHISFINSFLLTIAIGMTGFLLSLLDNSTFNPISCQKLFFTFGLLLTFSSILFGLGAAISRLFDFRSTVKKIKTEISDSKEDLNDITSLMKLYGKTTWAFLYLQIITLCVGTINLTIVFCWIHKDKLF